MMKKPGISALCFFITSARNMNRVNLLTAWETSFIPVTLDYGREAVAEGRSGRATALPPLRRDMLKGFDGLSGLSSEIKTASLVCSHLLAYYLKSVIYRVVLLMISKKPISIHFLI
jgi:hypothetical protein